MLRREQVCITPSGMIQQKFECFSRRSPLLGVGQDLVESPDDEAKEDRVARIPCQYEESHCNEQVNRAIECRHVGV